MEKALRVGSNRVSSLRHRWLASDARGRDTEGEENRGVAGMKLLDWVDLREFLV